MSIIITLLIFTVIVVIHEAGHFWVAKKSNVLVEEFAIGMGPKLIGKKFGETLYTIRILPIGGFCRMADEKPENTDRIGFNDATVIKRILICVAGPIMNFVLALIIMIFINMCVGTSTLEIVDIMEGSGAEAAQIQPGDTIVEYDGHSIHTRDELEFYKSENPGNAVDIVVKRNGEKIKTTITPTYNSDYGIYQLGIIFDYKAPVFNISGADFSGYDKASAFQYVSSGYWDCVSLVKLTVLSFGKMFTAQIGVEDLSGPIGVTSIVGDVYTESSAVGFSVMILSMLNLMALLSANLGVINLMPFPAIDGGKIVIYIIELISGYRLPKEKEAYIHFLGFAILMGLGIYIAYNDIVKLI